MENINFTAKLSPKLERKLIREVMQEDGNLKYIDRLARKLSQFPQGEIDIVQLNGVNHVRITKDDMSKLMPLPKQQGNNLDIMESLLQKDVDKSPRLAEVFSKLFGA